MAAKMMVMLMVMMIVAQALTVPAEVERSGRFVYPDRDYTPPHHPEDPCSRKGGVCGLESACPEEDRFPTKGLCPLQQKDGVECCKRIPRNIQSCRGHGGECVPSWECGKVHVVQSLLQICPDDHVCCHFE